MAHICFNLLSQKLHLPLGWWSFFWACVLGGGFTTPAIFVNPNPGEAGNLPKSARQKTADKPTILAAGKP
jgi:hypothetical protein